MSRSVVRPFVLAVVVAGLVGCQSGSRWAWWKRDAAPQDTSLLARSAAPPLPSSQAAPHAVAGAGMQMATPPSSANLAAAGAPGAVPAIPSSSSATIAAAPTALYPNTGVAPAGYPTSPASGPAVPPAATAMAQTGPYDPNGYRPSGASLAPSSVAAQGGGADRYADAFSAPTADRYATAPADRYATPPAAPTTGQVSPATLGAAASNNLPTVGQSATQPFAATTAVGTADAGVNVANTAAATVQLNAPPGQYRPGGTSDYTTGTVGHVEVATRPSAPITGTLPAAPAAITPPSSPIVPIPYAPSTGAGTGPY